MKITVRAAEEKDIPSLINLLLEVNHVHYLGRRDLFKDGKTKYDQEALRKKVHDSKERIFVAANTLDQVLGYAFSVLKVTKDDPILKDRKVLYLDDLCVEENYRGEHIGSLLFNRVKKEAEDLGCSSLTLNVWELNQSARKFYESLGMRPLKTTMEEVLSHRER